MRYLLSLVSALLIFEPLRLAAQPPATTAKPEPDVLILIDDERLVGHFVGSTGASVTFKSDVLGNVTADWSKIKELRTHGQYAVLPKDVQLRPHADTSQIPQGSVEVAVQTITIQPGAGAAPRTVPVGEAAQVIDQATFQKQGEHIPFTEAWNGAISAGASLVQATQQSHTFTGALSLVRALPVETAFPPRNRTTFNFTGSEGHVTQPGTPEIKTEIVHGDAERDQYLTASRVFGFGQLAFDHNYSQGLSLEQNYGGGIGWTVIRQANETLDLKGSMVYVRQQFRLAEDQNLIGTNFAEILMRKLNRGATFTEQLTVTPTWNNLNAWLASANAAINIPVYERLTFTLSAVDSYLHNPPSSFRRNSFQAITALTYTLR